MTTEKVLQFIKKSPCFGKQIIWIGVLLCLITVFIMGFFFFIKGQIASDHPQLYLLVLYLLYVSCMGPLFILLGTFFLSFTKTGWARILTWVFFVGLILLLIPFNKIFLQRHLDFVSREIQSINEMRIRNDPVLSDIREKMIGNPFEENIPPLSSYLISTSSSLQTKNSTSALGYDTEFPDVVNKAILRCGPTIQFLGLLIESGQRHYAFSRGSCSRGIARNIIIVPYNTAEKTIGDVVEYDMFYSNFGYDFGHEYTQSVSMQNWKINFSEALKVCSQHGGPSTIDQPVSVGLLLRQTNNQLSWKCIHADSERNLIVYINATTGEYLSTEGWEWSEMSI